eukprot:TRINITY_DN28025_c0_g1_i1.p1 TRINITY_DN28025_c0_g1~~TRINITY_DN28025_c0_g1_i1.p1  ORF type:complete len:102 (-),score=16.74 TRINITY_DN28025_c0_g1_i1:33-338(-)
MELAWALVEASGVTIPARARCLSRFLAHSSIATVTSGVAAGQASQWLHLSCGPLIPFLFGAWIGFTGACMSFYRTCLLYTSDAADEEDSVDLGGCRVINKK